MSTGGHGRMAQGGGNAPRTADHGSKTLQPGGVPSRRSHKGTVGK